MGIFLEFKDYAGCRLSIRASDIQSFYYSADKKMMVIELGNKEKFLVRDTHEEIAAKVEGLPPPDYRPFK